MTIATNNNIDSKPVVATTDSSHENYPSAPAVLIDDDDTSQQPNPFAAVSPYASSDPSSNYAVAQVVGSEMYPFRPQLAVATNIAVTATPLGPPTTTTTEVIHHDNLTASNPSSSASNPFPSVQVRGVQQSSVISAVFEEEALHKKVRRRRRRRVGMAVSGATGFVVGSFFPPVGAIVGAVAGATIARAASKAGERRKDNRTKSSLRMQEEHIHENHPA
jgi:hypothetical protein